MPWWGWSLIGWVGLSLLLAPLVGTAIREADRREVPGALARPEPRPVRRRIPVSPVAAVLLLVGVCLEAVGFVIRATGREQGAARLWSMDLPLAVPRMFIAALFTVAAVVALVAAARDAGRRPWWSAVGLVTGLIAQVKAGGTVHVRALEAAGVADRPVVGVLASTAVVGVVLALIWFSSRDERRDRRRVLTALGLYSVASVGLSAVSAVVSGGGSRFWSAAATFAEETGEAFGAVAVLVAVLVGVVPRLVLPAEWSLRRQADTETVDAPGVLRHPGARAHRSGWY